MKKFINKIVNLEDLPGIRIENSNKKIVHCHGVFDLFHYGHILHLEAAKRWGDILVVTITPEKFVNKGPGRPVYSDRERISLLAALEIVDYVAVNIEAKSSNLIIALKPNYYVKGQDYLDRGSDITGGILEEELAVRSIGGEIIFTEEEVRSSTELINKHIGVFDLEQKKVIDQIKSAHTVDEIVQLISKLSELRVLVVGEPIIDRYIFCEPTALSSKSPTVSARLLNQEDYAGGSLAIANHLAALGCKVELLIGHGNEESFGEIVNNFLSEDVDLYDVKLCSHPTAVKTRYLAPFRTQKLFETVKINNGKWTNEEYTKFVTLLNERAKKVDLIILADFGHGMFEGEVLEALRNIKTFLAVNVQTNSSNYGFNPYTKHNHYDYLCIDEREFRLGKHDRYSLIEELIESERLSINTARFSLTVGTAGSNYIDHNKILSSCPTFFKEVLDTTGAGDAYFSITSLLVKRGVDGVLLTFIGNCYAGLKTKILGNKKPVNVTDLVRTIRGILS